MSSIRNYVKTKKNKNKKQLKDAADIWIKASIENKIPYEIDWMGIPIIQTPEDMILMQELIYKVKPDIIVDIGIAHGGSSIYYSSLLELIKPESKVIGVDIDIREHNLNIIKKHPMYDKITLIEGDSINRKIFDEVSNHISNDSKVIVCLDSNHTKHHVLSELNLYSNIVSSGGYIVVFDTIASTIGRDEYSTKLYNGNGPKEAIDEFLKENNDFEIDKRFNKLYTSNSQDGYIRKK